MVTRDLIAGTDRGALFAKQIARAERLAAGFLATAAVVSAVVFSLGAATFVAIGDLTGRRYWVSAVMGLGALYEWTIAPAMRLALDHDDRPARWLPYLDVFVQLSIVTAVLAVAAGFAGPAGALSAPPVFGYALIAILTALRLDDRLCLFAGIVAGLQYALLTAWHWESLKHLGHEPVFSAFSFYASRSLVMALIGGAAAFVAREIRERTEAAIEQVAARERAVRIFGRYLDDDVVDTLLRSPEGLALGGQMRTVTIMMTDLRGFTSLSERLTPSEVISILNHFLGVMTGIVRRRRGTIDEFIGDAILGIFGAPFSTPDDATRAVACALEMQNAMPEVNRWNREHGLPELEMGIGINTGGVIVGNIGSEQRSKYGVVGSHVNLTSRIESYTVGGQILISEATRNAVGSRVTTDEGRTVRPKGVKEDLRIFEVKALGGEYGLEARTALPPLRTLSAEMAVRIRLVEGKDIGAHAWDGAFVRISEREGEIRCARSFRPLDNLRLEAMPRADGEAFAKVMGSGAGEGTVLVRFTARDESVVAGMNSWARIES